MTIAAPSDPATCSGLLPISATRSSATGEVEVLARAAGRFRIQPRLPRRSRRPAAGARHRQPAQGAARLPLAARRDGRRSRTPAASSRRPSTRRASSRSPGATTCSPAARTQPTSRHVIAAWAERYLVRRDARGADAGRRSSRRARDAARHSSQQDVIGRPASAARRRAGSGRRARQRAGPLRPPARRARRLHLDDACASTPIARRCRSSAVDGRPQARQDPRRRLRRMRDAGGMIDRIERVITLRGRPRRRTARAAPRDRRQVPGAPHPDIGGRDPHDGRRE